MIQHAQDFDAVELVVLCITIGCFHHIPCALLIHLIIDITEYHHKYSSEPGKHKEDTGTGALVSGKGAQQLSPCAYHMCFQ